MAEPSQDGPDRLDPPAGAPPAAISKAAQQWVAENVAAIEAWNAYVERHGVPLARCRRF